MRAAVILRKRRKCRAFLSRKLVGLSCSGVLRAISQGDAVGPMPAAAFLVGVRSRSTSDVLTRTACDGIARRAVRTGHANATCTCQFGCGGDPRFSIPLCWVIGGRCGTHCHRMLMSLTISIALTGAANVWVAMRLLCCG
jgi:hypothetical protein